MWIRNNLGVVTIFTLILLVILIQIKVSDTVDQYVNLGIVFLLVGVASIVLVIARVDPILRVMLNHLDRQAKSGNEVASSLPIHASLYEIMQSGPTVGLSAPQSEVDQESDNSLVNLLAIPSEVHTANESSEDISIDQTTQSTTNPFPNTPIKSDEADPSESLLTPQDIESTAKFLAEFRAQSFSNFEEAVKMEPLVRKWLRSLSGGTRDRIPWKPATIAKRLVMVQIFRESGFFQEEFEEQSQQLYGDKIPVGTLQVAITTYKQIFELQHAVNSD